jgi:hypothetical protein
MRTVVLPINPFQLEPASRFSLASLPAEKRVICGKMHVSRPAGRGTAPARLHKRPLISPTF